MNVTFHELAGIAIAQETAARLQVGAERPGRAALAWSVAMILAMGSHGILDALPHYYPLPSPVDAVVSIVLVAVFLLAMPRGTRWMAAAVALAALLPDIIDHVPEDLRRAGLDVPVPPNFFPWHWRSGSGSWPGRTGPQWIVSLVNHAIVFAFCAASIVRTRHLWRWPWRAR